MKVNVFFFVSRIIKICLSTPKSLTPVSPVKIASTFKLTFTNQSVKMPNCSDIYFRSKILQRTGKVWQKRLFLRREGLSLPKAPFSTTHRPQPSPQSHSRHHKACCRSCSCIISPAHKWNFWGAFPSAVCSTHVPLLSLTWPSNSLGPSGSSGKSQRTFSEKMTYTYNIVWK